AADVRAGAAAHQPGVAGGDGGADGDVLEPGQVVQPDGVEDRVDGGAAGADGGDPVGAPVPDVRDGDAIPIRRGGGDDAGGAGGCGRGGVGGGAQGVAGLPRRCAGGPWPRGYDPRGD